MNVSQIEISGFRSIRSITLPLRRMTLLVGGNGVGKTNLYRSLELLHAAAKGTLADEIAREGGLGSIHFAGELKKHEVHRLRLSATLEDIADTGLTYAIEIGFPAKIVAAAFDSEAQIKRETVSLAGKRPTIFMERDGTALWARDGAGRRVEVELDLLASETALSGLRGAYPELDAIRHLMAGWRFFHGFRTDAESPLRRPCPAVTAPLLNPDGGNLAAVFATLRHIRQETVDLDDAIERAFPGARLWVPPPEAQASFALSFADLPKRQFAAHELSDGTLQFLALLGALLSYRLPPLLALNEPESSLHPSLLPVLARVIARAAERTQVWVVTHSQILADAIAGETGAIPREVVRRDGATWVEGLTRLGQFDDQ
jgi:predicted ATPase